MSISVLRTADNWWVKTLRCRQSGHRGHYHCRTRP